MNGLDLNRFQFDYDQTWSVMFFRHDGTVLARYGTRGDKDGMSYNSLQGFTNTLRTVLDVDQNWQPQMQKQYGDKLGPRVQHSKADDIPSETISRILANEREGRQSCIHCHNVYDGLRDFAISQGDYDPAKRYKYPLPQNIGLHVDKVSGTKITKVIPNSAAAKAGIAAGQQITRMNGQAIHSIADIQFVLHHTGEKANIKIELDGPNGETTAIISVSPGWRVADIGWRASMYGMPPKPGLWVEAADENQKRELGIAQDKLALNVRGVFGNDVRRGGLKKGDVIVQFGDETAHHSEGTFHAHLRLNYYTPNARLPLKVIRDGRSVDLTVTFPNK
ncbi:MAG: PDZ domain-containing protein [Planctomycetales bacterium]|nr:PDZ domain-containing protein [Planctomycetales bacterium]